VSKVQPGRYTAQIEGDFVVFIIGMRINRLYKVHQWLPVAKAMPTMLRELKSSPIKGLLHVQQSVAGRSIVIVQYWRSYDALEAFAKDPNDVHLPAWRKYNQAVGSSGDVGVYHETYKVSAGDYEAVYANMPVFGLAKAGTHVPIGKNTQTSRQRMG